MSFLFCFVRKRIQYLSITRLNIQACDRRTDSLTPFLYGILKIVRKLNLFVRKYFLTTKIIIPIGKRKSFENFKTNKECVVCITISNKFNGLQQGWPTGNSRVL